jgi:hypothetical protein
MPVKQKVQVYVVQKFNWEYNDEYFYHDDEGSAIKTFRDRAKAEAYRMELEQACRDGINPFEMNDLDLAGQTSLNAGELARRLSAAGIEPPEGVGDDEDGYVEFFEWWMDHAEELTEEQRHLVWDLCDRARFYDIVETEVEVEE